MGTLSDLGSSHNKTSVQITAFETKHDCFEALYAAGVRVLIAEHQCINFRRDRCVPFAINCKIQCASSCSKGCCCCSHIRALLERDWHPARSLSISLHVSTPPQPLDRGWGIDRSGAMPLRHPSRGAQLIRMLLNTHHCTMSRRRRKRHQGQQSRRSRACRCCAALRRSSAVRHSGRAVGLGRLSRCKRRPGLLHWQRPRIPAARMGPQSRRRGEFRFLMCA